MNVNDGDDVIILPQLKRFILGPYRPIWMWVFKVVHGHTHVHGKYLYVYHT